MSTPVRVLAFAAVLYIFFISLGLIGTSFKLFGADAARDLLSATDNPMVGLLVGILATSLMQSSSTTTSLVVALVGTQALTVSQAIPIVMGANVGTTITNTIVSLGHIKQRDEFGRAFAGAVVHDFFNLCAVLVFLPLELIFHPIERAAVWLTGSMLGFDGATFSSPIKTITKPITQGLVDLGHGALGTQNDTVLGIILVVLSLGLLVFALTGMTRLIKSALTGRMKGVVERYLFGGTFQALTVGLLLTTVVQSSSVTTSLVIPLIGIGAVSLPQAFPFMLGANIGTTVTAMLAALASNSPAAVTIAMCHLLFNLFGTAVFLPLRAIPIYLAQWFGSLCGENRWAGPLYVGTVFFAVPGLLVSVF